MLSALYLSDVLHDSLLYFTINKNIGQSYKQRSMFAYERQEFGYFVSVAIILYNIRATPLP